MTPSDTAMSPARDRTGLADDRTFLGPGHDTEFGWPSGRMPAADSRLEPAFEIIRQICAGAVRPPARSGKIDVALLPEWLLRLRTGLRLRLGTDLFVDPGFDIVLVLMAAEYRKRRVAISDCAYATGLPPTTALRWTGILQRRGLVERHRDPDDRRRCFVQLSPPIRAALLQCLEDNRFPAGNPNGSVAEADPTEA